ncbi:hypothetical protein J1N35_015024 [Gossypium stocksii]|uniref:Uncharacterized protein n=1 Tax=Gossypium stocksii TaxID=47602 RepID=A0A9D4A874_9ROSI|nr:hypothetical protein J1N35_015024 [Gossypium stocksii]
MFKRFPSSGEEGANDDGDEEEALVMPSDYERVFQPNRSSMNDVAIYDPSHHNSTKTSGRQATKALAGHEKGKAPMVKESKLDSD